MQHLPVALINLSLRKTRAPVSKGWCIVVFRFWGVILSSECCSSFFMFAFGWRTKPVFLNVSTCHCNQQIVGLLIHCDKHVSTDSWCAWSWKWWLELLNLVLCASLSNVLSGMGCILVVCPSRISFTLSHMINLNALYSRSVPWLICSKILYTIYHKYFVVKLRTSRREIILETLLFQFCFLHGWLFISHVMLDIDILECLVRFFVTYLCPLLKYYYSCM